jgi:hypothetical protein
VDITNKHFGAVMSRVRFLQIFLMVHVGNDTTEEIKSGHQKDKESTRGDRIYRETVSEIFFALCPCCTNFSSKTARLVALRGFKISSQPGCGIIFFPNATTGEGYVCTVVIWSV